MRRTGFTLLEVLVGIALLALAAVVLGAAYANTLGAHQAARRAGEPDGLAHLRAALLAEPDRAKVEQGGVLDLPASRRLQWEAQVEEMPVPDLFAVTVSGRTSGGADAEEQRFSRRLMLLRPTWSDPERREQLRADWRQAREAAARR